MGIAQLRKNFGRKLLALLLGLTSAVPTLSAQRPTTPAVDLVRQTVHNELAAANDRAKFMFRDRRETPRGSQTKLMVETQDAMVGLVIAINDKPLTDEQRVSEDARVNRFVKDPAELKKRQRQEKEETERVTRIMKALPDAFLYEYDGNEPGQPGMGEPGQSLVRVKFQPNPNYDPPSRVEQVLTGMAGYLLIDPVEDRIARIDGKLVSEVSFGWGILGHLDPGGHFLVTQADVGKGHWEISRMDLAFTGKILIFKSINFIQTEVASDFQPVPSNLTFAQGLELLRKQQAVLAENDVAHPSNSSK